MSMDLRDARKRVYSNWCNIRHLTTNPKHASYKYIGGRGITMHAPWLDDFRQFLEDVGYPESKGQTLRRIDPDDGYRPGNVHWSLAHGVRAQASIDMVQRAARGLCRYPGMDEQSSATIRCSINRELVSWGLALRMAEAAGGLFDLAHTPLAGRGADTSSAELTEIVLTSASLQQAAEEAMAIIARRAARIEVELQQKAS